MTKDVAHGSLLDELSLEHDGDAVGRFRDDAEIVGDQQQRQVERVFISRSSSSTCAWIVTSSAVVGSSAMTSGGRQASAIAIRTRCRMPPDS